MLGPRVGTLTGGLIQPRRDLPITGRLGSLTALDLLDQAGGASYVAAVGGTPQCATLGIREAVGLQVTDDRSLGRGANSAGSAAQDSPLAARRAARHASMHFSRS